MKEKYLISERGKTYYWLSKSRRMDAANLVFLPGLTADHRLFDRQLPHFTDRYNVLVWDSPAHGKSRPYLDFSYTCLAEELRSILDTEHMTEVILIGQSAGGFTAQSFISRWPSRVNGFFAIGTCPYGPSYYSRSDIFWLKQTEWMLRLFPDGLLRRTMTKMCSVTAEGRKNMEQMLAWYPKKELCHLMYLGFSGFIPEIQELDIPCPVCLAVGDMDRTGKVRKYNEMWHEEKSYPLHIIEGASHNANVDRPEELNRLIEEFICSCKA